LKTFFLIGGLLLAVSGILQAVVRPRSPKETGMARYVNRHTIRALVFACGAAFFIAMGLGLLPMPGHF
jgi:hypothetical protein